LSLAALACAQSLSADRAVFFSLSPRQACEAVYGANPFPEMLDVARHIEPDTTKDQRVVVMGSEPELYFYTRRHSSTRQIYTFPLMEAQPFARKMQDDMIREIEQNPPEFLVFVKTQNSWLATPQSSLRLLDWMGDYVEKNMDRVGLIQFAGPHETETVWGPAAAAAAIRRTYFIAVFRRAGSAKG
jgi:hypothetical protein